MCCDQKSQHFFIAYDEWISNKVCGMIGLKGGVRNVQKSQNPIRIHDAKR